MKHCREIKEKPWATLFEIFQLGESCSFEYPEKISFPYGMKIFLFSTYLIRFSFQIIMNTRLGFPSVRNCHPQVTWLLICKWRARPCGHLDSLLPVGLFIKQSFMGFWRFSLLFPWKALRMTLQFVYLKDLLVLVV